MMALSFSIPVLCFHGVVNITFQKDQSSKKSKQNAAKNNKNLNELYSRFKWIFRMLCLGGGGMEEGMGNPFPPFPQNDFYIFP